MLTSPSAAAGTIKRKLACELIVVFVARCPSSRTIYAATASANVELPIDAGGGGCRYPPASAYVRAS